MGEPVAWQWADEESFADLFTAWYTDREPASALVAELDGRVVGYLLGCRDSRRVTPPSAAIRRHVLRRGLLARRGTAGVLWRSAVDLTVAATRSGPATGGLDDRWPAHLHIDLLPEARGTGMGRALVERWLNALRTDGIRGCHLETWAENDGAVAFFEAMGFRRHGTPTPMPGLRSPEGHRHHSQLMTQTLAPMRTVLSPTRSGEARPTAHPVRDDHGPPPTTDRATAPTTASPSRPTTDRTTTPMTTTTPPTTTTPATTTTTTSAATTTAPRTTDRTTTTNPPTTAAPGGR